MAERKDYDRYFNTQTRWLQRLPPRAVGRIVLRCSSVGSIRKVADVEPPEEKKRAEPAANTEEERLTYQKPATYRIGSDVIDRINVACDRYSVQKSSFVRALLIHALDQLEAGSWELPPPEAARKTINVGLVQTPELSCCASYWQFDMTRRGG